MSETIIRGVTLSRIDRKSLIKAKKSLKLDCDTSTDGMVASLADHLIRLFKADPSKLLGCDYCGGASDLSFDRCPYCGKTDAEATQAAEEAAAKEPSAPKEQPVVNAKPGKKPRSAAVAKAPSPEATATPNKLSLIQTDEAAASPASVSLVVHQAELVTTKDLDDKVSAIRAIQVDIVDHHWKLGKLLGETLEIFKLRTNGEGQPRYKNWGQFVAEEIGITPQYAYGLIGVSRAFTQEDVREVGVTKLRIIAHIPDEAKRENLKERAKVELTNGKQMTTGQLKEASHAARQEASNNDKSRPGPKVKPQTVLAPANGVTHVTHVTQDGKREVQLFAGASSEPARDLDDQPTGVEDAVNDVRIRYRLRKNADGSLVLEVEQIRGSERRAV